MKRRGSGRATPGSEDVARVIEAWRLRRPRPELIRVTTERKELVARRMNLGYTADDLIALIDWAHESREEAATWLRGEHPRNRTPYLDLTNLLREEKLGRRVESALLWREGEHAAPDLHVDADPYRLVSSTGPH